MIYYLFKYIVLPFYWLIRMPKIYGKENLKLIKKGKAIIISNHRSMLDPLFIALISNRFIHFMAKSELFDNKLSAWLFRNLLVFPINRGKSDMNSIKRALEVLQQDKVFGIFPEGKRSVTNDIDLFEKGAAFLAVKSEAPILPMYIPVDNYRLFKRPRIYIGELITADKYQTNKAKSVIVREITTCTENVINELKIISEEDK